VGRPKVSDETFRIIAVLARRGAYLAEHAGRYLLVDQAEATTVRVNPRRGHSLVVRALVELNGERDGAKIYTIAPKGLKMAEGE